MTFQDAMQYIHSLNRFGSKPGLDRICALLNLLGNPQENLRFVHVAGTNGKGSTCAMLSSIFTVSGLKTGLFISPFVVDFRERIQICGEYISEDDLARLTNQVKLASETVSKSGDDATEFEFITALAFLYYKETNCDIVILETGLGGRLDSTNIIKKSDVSVIMKIGLDHTDILGDTIEKIAYEKCGIIKNGSCVVTAPNQPPEALTVIRQSANEKGCMLYIPDYNEVCNIKTTPFSNSFTYKDMSVEIPLAGTHQIENAITAIETAQLCGILNEKIEKGLSIASFPARLEVISKTPLVILDGAHNPDGAAVLGDYIRNLNDPPVAIVGMMSDKDLKKSLSQFAPLCKSIITVTVTANARSASAIQLAEAANNYCENVYVAETYQTALEKADQIANGHPIIICGSLYLASDIREAVINRYK